MDSLKGKLSSAFPFIERQSESPHVECAHIHGDFEVKDPSSSIMPLWSGEDTRNAALASLVPAALGTAGVYVYMKDPATTKWWETLKKPSYLSPRNVKLLSAVDLAAVAPIGYASYLVWKHGGGFDYNDTRLALGVYAANIVFVGATIPLMKKKNLSCLARNTILIHASAVAAAFLFYKIHKPAGYWLAPYAVWTAFYAFFTYAIKKENDPVQDL